MIRQFGLAGLMLAIAQPAAALSCQRPSIAGTFNALNAAEETYIMVRGTVASLPGEQSEPEGELNERQSYVVQAQFTGDMATASGFDRPLDIPLTVEVGCAGPWCGGVPEGEVIAFLEQRNGRYVLAAGPCPFSALTASEEAQVQAMSCLRAEACEDDAPNLE
ncbi:MAG: hypothetical protein AAF366_01075 [Pseudomonadota bacterium]